MNETITLPARFQTIRSELEALGFSEARRFAGSGTIWLENESGTVRVVLDLGDERVDVHTFTLGRLVAGSLMISGGMLANTAAIVAALA